ncbi:MAG TPA: immunoglobulin domain-containing protein, partial [Phnomibacter sp.]|nr:immunoglobulin domain-containing protein [Phnomibacter sp.]
TDPAFTPASQVGSGTGPTASLSVSPAATTTYYLRIEDQAGPCPNNLAGPGAGVTLTVNQPSVTPTALSASTAVICSGSSTTLSQTGGSLGTGATWNWYSDAGFTNFVGSTNAANASLVVSPTVTTTYYLRIEDQASPCSNDIPVPGSVLVTVNNPSVAPASLATSQATICAGSAATLTQSGGNLGTNAVWRWYSDAGYTNLVGQGAGADASLSVNPTVTTTYYLRIEATAVPCSTIVNAPGSVTVTVTNPSVAPTALVAGPATICLGGNTTLTQTGGSLGNGATWRWYSDAGFSTQVGSSTDANASLTVTPTVNTTYYLRAEGALAPCTPTVAGPGSGIAVVVNIPPSIGTQPANQAVCQTETATLTVTANGNVTGYQWFKKNATPPDQAVGTNSNTLTIPNVQLTNAGEYYVVVNGAAPCVSVTSALATLIVNQAIDIQSQPRDTVVCESGSATFSVTAFAGSATLNYQWRKDGTNIPGANSASYTIPNVAFADAANYDVVISGASGFACSNAISATATLAVNPRPMATIAASAPNACVNDALTVTFTGSNSTRPYTFHYTENGVSKTISTTGSNDAVSVDLSSYSPGDYEFILTKVTDAAGTLCERDITGQTVAVVVKPRPVVTATPPDNNICSGQNTGITLSSNLGATTSFAWVVQSASGVSGMADGTSNSIDQTLTNTT